MKKNKAICCGLLAAVVLSSCASFTRPVAHDKGFPPDGRYEILGPVYVEGKTFILLGMLWFGGLAYIDLLAEARDKFRSVDDVVNVSRDEDIFSVLGIWTTVKTRLHGTAIRYVKGPAAAE